VPGTQTNGACGVMCGNGGGTLVGLALPLLFVKRRYRKAHGRHKNMP